MIKKKNGVGGGFERSGRDNQQFFFMWPYVGGLPVLVISLFAGACDKYK